MEKTILNQRHRQLGAKMVEFGGWDMPLQYAGGVLQEHLATRKAAGLFDVSHMGRFEFSGPDAVRMLQFILTNNAAGLQIGQSQYTILADETGGAIDDAYLYRFEPDKFLLVVNAANSTKDAAHWQQHRAKFPRTNIVDCTSRLAMLSLQGPRSQEILQSLLEDGHLPEPRRNCLSTARIRGAKVLVARTGYTGEPWCFELFLENSSALMIFDLLIANGATPVGLAARDTLRLEAALPLYGHELGLDPDGGEIPVLASSCSRIAVSFAPEKGDFLGRAALQRQYADLQKIKAGDFSARQNLPRIIQPLALREKAVPRAGYRVYHQPKPAGFVTSGTMVPYWKKDESSDKLSGQWALRPVCLALMDSFLQTGDTVQVELRDKMLPAQIVKSHLTAKNPPFAYAIIH